MKRGYFFLYKYDILKASIGMKPAIPPVCIGTYRSLLWKLIPVSSIPFPYIFFRQRRSQWSDSVSSYAEKENRFLTRYEPVFLFIISAVYQM